MKRPAIFLDRDGVLNENRPNYVRAISDLEILPGIVESMAELAKFKYAVVIITNQSAVGKQIISLETAQEINQSVVNTLQKSGGRIDLALICPHNTSDNCDCRKPKPGMLLNAAQQLGLDLARSWLVGDALTDIQAGLAAGVRPILVESGRGKQQLALVEQEGLQVPVCTGLPEALRFIYQQDELG